jgi:hypothetical protein
LSAKLDAEMVAGKQKIQQAIASDQAQPSRVWFVGCILLLILAATIPFAFSLHGEFVFDDRSLILTSMSEHGLRDLPAVFTRAFISNPDQPLHYYRPLVTASFMLDYAIYGKHVFGFKVTNLLLHVVTTLLVFALARRLLTRGPAPLLASLLFAVHPAHTESVAWTSGRTDVIATLFGLAAFLSFIRYIELKNRKWLILSACLFLMALLSKEIAVVMPVLMIAYVAFMHPQIRWKRIATDMLPFITVAAGFLILRHIILAQGIAQNENAMSLVERILLAPDAVLWYLRILAFPARAESIHDVFGLFQRSPALIAAGWIAISALIIGALLLRRKSPTVSIAVLWMLVAIVPVCNIIPLPWTVIAERFLYLPSVGICLLFGVIVSRVWSVQPRLLRDVWPLITAVGLAGFLAYCAMQTYAGAPLWSNNKALSSSLLARAPGITGVHLYAGETFAACGDLNRSVREYRKVLDAAPKNPTALTAIFMVYMRLGQPAEAAKSARRLAEIKPDDAAVHNDLGTALAASGNLAGAIEAFKEASQIDPKSATVHFNLARALARNGDNSGAIEEYQNGLALDSNNERAKRELDEIQSKISLP